jgi:hypothetical protein
MTRRYQYVTDSKYMDALRTVARRMNYDLFGPEVIQPEWASVPYDEEYDRFQVLIANAETVEAIRRVINTLDGVDQIRCVDENLTNVCKCAIL